jgi:hypothetical protein
MKLTGMLIIILAAYWIGFWRGTARINQEAERIIKLAGPCISEALDKWPVKPWNDSAKIGPVKHYRYIEDAFR